MPNPIRLSDTQIRILRFLRPGVAVQPGMMGIPSSSLSKHLKPLVVAGYVERLDVGDRLYVAYRITATGLEACPPRNAVSQSREAKPPVMGDNVRGPTYARSRRSIPRRIG